MTTTKKTTARKTVAQRKSAERNDKQNDVVARITNAVDAQLAAEKTIADAKSAAIDASTPAGKAERVTAALAENRALKAWEKGGKKGKRPSTANIEALDAESAKPASERTSKKSSEPRSLIAALVDRNVETIKCVSCGETKPSNVFPTRGKDKRATECRDCGIVRRGGEPKAAKPKAAAKKTTAKTSTTSKSTPAKSTAKKTTKPAAKKTTKAA